MKATQILGLKLTPLGRLYSIKWINTIKNMAFHWIGMFFILKKLEKNSYYFPNKYCTFVCHSLLHKLDDYNSNLVLYLWSD